MNLGVQAQQNIRNQEFNLTQQVAVVKRFEELFLREQIDASQLGCSEQNGG